jgi:hypothetical protein
MCPQKARELLSETKIIVSDYRFSNFSCHGTSVTLVIINVIKKSQA